MSQNDVDYATREASDATVSDGLHEGVEVVQMHDSDGAVRLESELKGENEDCMHAILKRLRRVCSWRDEAWVRDMVYMYIPVPLAGTAH